MRAGGVQQGATLKTERSTSGPQRSQVDEAACLLPFAAERFQPIARRRIVRFTEPGLNEIYAVVMANEVALRERRPTLVKGLRALDAACAYIKAHPDEALQIGAQHSQMDPAVAADAIGRMRFGLTADVPAMSAKMTDEARWAVAEGVARPGTAVPDYAAFIDPTILAEARRA